MTTKNRIRTIIFLICLNIISMIACVVYSYWEGIFSNVYAIIFLVFVYHIMKDMEKSDE